MIIRYQNINELNIESIAGMVSEERIKKSEKYRYEEDKKRSIAVEYLLNQMINEAIPGIKTPAKLIYDEKGKPHIYRSVDGNDKKGEIYFSLSHSGDYVACIIADRPCGIDVERHSDKRDYEKVAKRICTETELTEINNETEFYDVWTLKESVLKAVGLGLSLDMRKFEIKKSADFESNEVFETNVDGIKFAGKIIPEIEGYSLSYIVEQI